MTILQERRQLGEMIFMRDNDIRTLTVDGRCAMEQVGEAICAASGQVACIEPSWIEAIKWSAGCTGRVRRG